MKKKLVAGAVTLLSVVTLAACANGTNKDIVTMKGDTITVSDFYDEIKTNQGAQQVLFQMTINKVFEKEYGSKVSDKEVDKELAKQKKPNCFFCLANSLSTSLSETFDPYSFSKTLLMVIWKRTC